MGCKNNVLKTNQPSIFKLVENFNQLKFEDITEINVLNETTTGVPEHYSKSIDNLREQLMKGLFGLKLEDIQASLYLGSGDDSIFPVQLLNNTHLHVGVSREVFILESDMKENSISITTGKANGGSYAHIIELEGFPMATDIISNILALNSNHRILMAKAFKIQESSGVHGVILFDSGPGTQAKAYLHINENLYDVKDSIWWRRLLPSRNIAVLLKGSQEISRTENFIRIEDEFSEVGGNLFVATDFTGKHKRASELNRTSIWAIKFKNVRSIPKSAFGIDLGYHFHPYVTVSFSR